MTSPHTRGLVVTGGDGGDLDPLDVHLAAQYRSRAGLHRPLPSFYGSLWLKSLGDATETSISELAFRIRVGTNVR